MSRARRGGLVAGFATGLLLTAVGPRPASAGLLVTANDDAYSVAHDRVLSMGGPGLLANDSGVGLTAAQLSGTAHGTVTVATNGGITYQPTAGYVGPDAFTYQARVLNLGILVTDSATVRLTVTNAAPTATKDSYAATTGVTLSVAAPGVLGNDHDPDGDALRAVLVDGGGNGSLSLASNGGFTFTSGGSFSGMRTFTYRASDGLATSSVATVTISVSAAATPMPTPTPPPGPTATPSPTPTAVPTTVPSPTPATSPPPIATPGPSGASPPAPTPTPSVRLRPSSTPGPAGGSPAATPAVGSELPSPGRGSTGTTGSSGGSPGGGGSPNAPSARDPGGLQVDGPPSGAGALDPIDVVGALGLGSLLDWAVPALVLTVPGLLLVLAVLAQMLGGLVWLPLVRRWLGGLGLRRRRGATAG